MELTTNNNTTNEPEAPEFEARVQAIQRRLATDLQSSYDIVCGSGSSGSVVARHRGALIELLAERRHCVLNARRDFPEILSLDDAIRLHLLEILDQHLLADLFHHTAQFSETVRLRSQHPQNQPFPFPADHVERCVQAATLGLLSYSKLLPHGNSYYGEVITCFVGIKIDIRQSAEHIGGRSERP